MLSIQKETEQLLNKKKKKSNRKHTNKTLPRKGHLEEELYKNIKQLRTGTSSQCRPISQVGRYQA